MCFDFVAYSGGDRSKKMRRHAPKVHGCAERFDPTRGSGHKRRSSVNFGGDIFARKYMHEKINKMPEFYTIFFRKINKIPKFYMIYARKN